MIPWKSAQTEEPWISAEAWKQRTRSFPGADQVNVRVTDQIGNLDVATSESETSDISLDMESSSEKQQFTLATPGSVKLTTTMEDEQIDLFGNRVKIAGGANSALLQFSRIPGSLFVLVPGGNNRINVVTTMAETIIRTGNGSDTFILGGAVDDEEDMEYTFDYSGKNGGEAQSGMMGAGNQHKLDISTEGGENTWHLWMSGAPFYLEGGTGHDTFIRYTFTITDKDGNTKIFATPHYNISSKGGNITKIGFPSYGGNRRPVVSGSQGTWILTEARNLAVCKTDRRIPDRLDVPRRQVVVLQRRRHYADRLDLIRRTLVLPASG